MQQGYWRVLEWHGLGGVARWLERAERLYPPHHETDSTPTQISPLPLLGGVESRLVAQTHYLPGLRTPQSESPGLPFVISSLPELFKWWVSPRILRTPDPVPKPRTSRQSHACHEQSVLLSLRWNPGSVLFMYPICGT